MLRISGIAILALLLNGCATSYVPYESGKIWCNNQVWKKSDFHETHLKVAKRGYIYALAGALALQSSNSEGETHYFPTPKRLVELKPRPERDPSGFEVATFELYSLSDPEKLQEVIIAFTGSNDGADWFWTNLLLDKSQYILAEKHVLSVAKNQKYANTRLVTAGYSLGGALAVHVKKNPETSKYISETWAFNSSPKIYAPGNLDPDIWMASVRGEALEKLRWPIFRVFPGVSRIGAPEPQRAEDYYLVSANAAYSHFRWVLTRNILFVADLAMTDEDASRNEPIEILRSSNFSACHP